MIGLPLRVRPSLDDTLPDTLFRGASTPDNPTVSTVDPQTTKVIDTLRALKPVLDTLYPQPPDAELPKPEPVPPVGARMGAVLASAFAGNQTHNPALVQSTLSDLQAQEDAPRKFAEQVYLKKQGAVDANAAKRDAITSSLLSRVLSGQTDLQMADDKINAAWNRAMLRAQTEKDLEKGRAAYRNASLDLKNRLYNLAVQQHSDLVNKWDQDRNDTRLTAMQRTYLDGVRRELTTGMMWALSTAKDDAARHDILEAAQEQWDGLYNQALQNTYPDKGVIPTPKPTKAGHKPTPHSDVLGGIHDGF